MESPTTLAEFAEQYRLRVKHDECGDLVIRGKFEHLCELDSGRFGIVLEAPANNARTDKTIRARKRRAIAAGFRLRQKGESEAILLFDPGDQKQTALAVRIIHAKKKRQAAPPTDATLRREPSSWSGRLGEILLNKAGWSARKNPAVGEIFS
ncbi:MAG: hypothetical protein WB780_12555 [Candidatus Acidiferrales bacterium]